MNKEKRTEAIRDLALTSGIDTLGITHAEPFLNYRISDSIRCDPSVTVPHAKSIIVAGIYIGGLTLPVWTDMNYGRTSRLFQSGFFLDIIKPLLPIKEYLDRQGYKTLICDSADTKSSVIPLKLAAIRAGLGWQGKQSLLLTKTYGTFLALGGLITDADLDHHRGEEKNRCKTCTKCQDACPGNALTKDHVLDKDKCISYQLQTESLIPNTIQDNQIMDCEICQDICPWNRKHIKHPLQTHTGELFKQKEQQWSTFFELSHLKDLTEKEYGQVIGKLGTSIPYSIFMRNVRICLNQTAG